MVCCYYDYIYDTVQDHTKTVIPHTKITASCGWGGHFPPFVGAIRLIHLGACYVEFGFVCLCEDEEYMRETKNNNNKKN